MSELKVYEDMEDYIGFDYDTPTEMYEKSEADKVIEELEMKLATAQQVLRLNKPEALFADLETMGRLSHERDVVSKRERKQKYKRCLAMARERGIAAQMQHDFSMRFKNSEYVKRAEWNEKWRNRWLALADKLKEKKSCCR